MLERTRMSLYYLASYLWLGGISMLAAPEMAADLLQSNSEYNPVMLRALGMFLIGLAVIVVQIIRHRLAVLYPTTLALRLFFCLCLAGFYVTTRDPLFAVLLAIVGLGVVMTGLTYLGERRAS